MTPNYVYLAVADDGRTRKIGHSVNPRSRIASIPQFQLEKEWLRYRGDGAIIEEMALWFLRVQGATQAAELGREYFLVEAATVLRSIDRAIAIWDGNTTEISWAARVPTPTEAPTRKEIAADRKPLLHERFYGAAVAAGWRGFETVMD